MTEDTDLTPFWCPVDGCEFGHDDDRSLDGVRQHVYAMSDDAHDWDALRTEVEAQTTDEGNEDSDDEVDPSAEASGEPESGSPDDQDDTDQENDDMPTPEELERQQERQQIDDDPDDGDDTDTGTSGGVGIPTSAVVAVAVVVLLAALVVMYGRSDTEPQPISDPADEQGDEVPSQYERGHK